MYKRMTPEAFRAALVRLGLTYHQAAVLLGKNKRLIQRWASGSKEIPQSIKYCLMWHCVRDRLPKIVIPADDARGTSFSVPTFIRWCAAISLPHNGKEVATFLPEIPPADD
jgi:hypothetical protein